MLHCKNYRKIECFRIIALVESASIWLQIHILHTRAHNIHTHTTNTHNTHISNRYREIVWKYIRNFTSTTRNAEHYRLIFIVSYYCFCTPAYSYQLHRTKHHGRIHDIFFLCCLTRCYFLRSYIILSKNIPIISINNIIYKR